MVSIHQLFRLFLLGADRYVGVAFIGVIQDKSDKKRQNKISLLPMSHRLICSSSCGCSMMLTTDLSFPEGGLTEGSIWGRRCGRERRVWTRRREEQHTSSFRWLQHCINNPQKQVRMKSVNSIQKKRRNIPF